ncbi:hypothetical protein ACFV4M_04130 [Kitasatospora indigofera]|uniref:hypothetical protein n=1 Tax=Kitasatospora indigofera TaxID=67307 RepID=UPI00366594B4
MTQAALFLDGRGRVDEAVNLFTFGEDEMRWLCWLYGYRLEYFHQVSSSYRSAHLRAVLDPDPRARLRGDWMRRPDLRPGTPSPLPWTVRRSGDTSPLWTPPGWPPGHGPLRPAPGRMPLPGPEQIQDRYHPAGVFALAGALALGAAAVAATYPLLAAGLALAALAACTAYRPLKHHRERLQQSAAHRQLPYDRAPGAGPPPLPDDLASERPHREDEL